MGVVCRVGAVWCGLTVDDAEPLHMHTPLAHPTNKTHRHVRLPAAFPSLEAYAQGMGCALTEELNLTLHETVHISLYTYTYMYV